jgi:hypothetical protein
MLQINAINALIQVVFILLGKNNQEIRLFFCHNPTGTLNTYPSFTCLRMGRIPGVTPGMLLPLEGRRMSYPEIAVELNTENG